MAGGLSHHLSTYRPSSKNPPNKALDAILGALGLIGLLIELIRQNENEVSWAYFVTGFVSMSFLSLLFLLASCVALVALVGEPA